MKPRFTLQIQGVGQMLPQILLKKGIGFNQWESGAAPDLSSAPGVTQLHQPQPCGVPVPAPLPESLQGQLSLARGLLQWMG